MSGARILLVNPRITSRARARFPLSLLELSASLEARQHQADIVDGNVEGPACAAKVLLQLRERDYDAVGLSVMGGPQVATALELSRVIRAARPKLPIIWGGYFPSLYPDAAFNGGHVDFLVRDTADEALCDLLDALPRRDAGLAGIANLTWRDGARVVHNPSRPVARVDRTALLPYEKLGDPRQYLVESFLGRRTAVHQAAIGCRFRCTFCGVAAMFRGKTLLPAAARLERDLTFLRDEIGADSIQFFDHNFFDREEDMVPLLEVLARLELPWWCYARADALVGLSAEAWKLVRRSRLRMAYIGAETPNDRLLKAIRKGTRSDQTLEVADICRRNGVIPELSFMVAPPEDPEGETEKTFDFIRQVKRVNPQSEIIVYVYTPLPAESVPDSQRLRLAPLRDLAGRPVLFPANAEEWTQPQWVAYACHGDAPWITPRLRRRIHDFVTVLRCRFPTVQDTRAPPWAKAALRGLASWRYALRMYGRPWELDASRRLIDLVDPRVTSI